MTVTLEDGTETELDHGRVVIAAITSCTNTSNPTVMVGAGLLAKKAVERGLESKPWVKTSLAPGSTVVTDYLDQAGLTEYLDKLGFNLVGYGCTTCIGNSGPLPEEISKVGERERPRRLLGALGQSQLRGPDQPGRPQQLPRLAAALRRLRAGRADGRRHPRRAARRGLRGRARLPARHLAHQRGDQADGRRRRPLGHVHEELRGRLHGRRALARGSRSRRATATSGRTPPTSASRRTSRAWAPSRRRPEPIEGARVLAVLGDSVTTDHISPAGAIKKDSPAGSG